MSRLTSQSHDNGFRAKNPDGMMEAYSDDGDREADMRGGGHSEHIDDGTVVHYSS